MSVCVCVCVCVRVCVCVCKFYECILRQGPFSIVFKNVSKCVLKFLAPLVLIRVWIHMLGMILVLETFAHV